MNVSGAYLLQKILFVCVCFRVVFVIMSQDTLRPSSAQSGKNYSVFLSVCAPPHFDLSALEGDNRFPGSLPASPQYHAQMYE